MKTTVVFFYVGLFTSVVVSGDNGFSLENIAKEGLDFRDLVEHALSLKGFSDISSECNEQLRALRDENEHALWQMADAWSKFPYPGALYYSSKRDYGNYDECLKVDVNSERGRVIGKYCPWGFRLPDLRPNQSIPVFLLAYCVPDKCSADDLNNLLGLPGIFNDIYCSTKDTDSELDAGAVVSIVIFLMIFVSMIFSTAYDAYLHYAEKKCPHPIFKAFSMYDNGKKLLQHTRHTQGGEQILCFHGMKFISMWWIISGHGAIATFLAPALNEADRAGWRGKRYSQYIVTAHISVDTFFYISGFLMAYLYFKNDVSKKSVVQQVKVVPSMILHRYLRLTPAIAACFLGSVYLLKYTREGGPFFSYGLRTGLIEPCKKYWWTYFLYIQNYYNYHYGESLCIPTTWYLSADMQLFLITPLIIIPISVLYRRSFRTTMSALVVLNLIFLGLPIFTKLHWQHYDPDFNEYDFHSKLISYFIGVMMGIYMRHERHKTFAISKTLNVLMWFLALGTMLAVMFYRQDVQLKGDYVPRSLCYSFTRPMWCLALSWITFACVKGYGGPINWLLSCSFMQLGSKLTYCIYVVHGMIIFHYAIGERGKLYFSDWHLFVQNCSYFVVSMLGAAVWSLAFELPMITIERIVFQGTPKPAKPKVDGPIQSEHQAAA